MNATRLVLFITALWQCLLSVAQINQPIQEKLLDEVMVITKIKRVYNSETGKKRMTLDSSTLSNFNTASVSELLAANTPLFVKAYGPGAISSLSFRGGNASQNAVLWGGMNIQNNMLGQTDLSLLQTWLFDDVYIEFGGNAAIAGSGAAAGTIYLGNKRANFVPHAYLQSQVSGGNFQNYQAGMRYSQGSTKSSHALSVYRNASQNRFPYKSADGSLKTMANADYNMNGLLTSNAWRLSVKNTVSFDFWGTINQRQLPQFYSNDFSQQWDKNQKSMFQWQHKEKNYYSTFRTAWFTDLLNYKNYASTNVSRADVHQVFTEHESFYHGLPHHFLTFGVQAANAYARSTEYSKQRQMGRVAIFAHDRALFFKNKLSASFATRYEYFSTGEHPLTGTAGVEYEWKKLTIGSSCAKVFRQPTFNERYWQPGGDPNILPEKGYTTDAFISWEKSAERHKISLQGSLYSRWMNNWITWLPGPALNPYAANILAVWSRGTESLIRYQLQFGPIDQQNATGLTVNTSYNLSTITADASAGTTNTLHKQLVYTPRYIATAHAWLKLKPFTFNIYYQYAGYRFTSTDNHSWLTPYHLVNVHLGYHLKNDKIEYNWFLKLNNVTNTNYQVMAGYPMPLFGIEGGVNVIIIKKSN
jgi:iron complex outermembrane receptor protein